MLPDIEELKQTYSGLSNQKLIELAVEQAAGLRLEAVEALKVELQNRGFFQYLQEGIEVQCRQPGPQELDEYCNLIRNLPCPHCKNDSHPLNAALISEVMSVIIFTTHEKRFIIACPTCLDSANSTATIKSAILGWWGLPMGIIRTIQALFSNSPMKRKYQSAEPTLILKEFVSTNIGKIEIFKNDSKKLQGFVSQYTKSE